MREFGCMVEIWTHKHARKSDLTKLYWRTICLEPVRVGPHQQHAEATSWNQQVERFLPFWREVERNWTRSIIFGDKNNS